MRANEWLDELVQLYEYRVEDLHHGRSPRGDKQAFLDLRELLMTADTLDSGSRRRLMAAERQFRDLQRRGEVHFRARPRKSAQSAQAAQAEVLRTMAQRLWHADARRWVSARLWATRSEPRLMPLRTLLTATLNLQHEQRGEPQRALVSLGESVSLGLAGPHQIDALTESVLELLSTYTGRQQLLRAVAGLWGLSLQRWGEPPSSPQDMGRAIFTDDGLSSLARDQQVFPTGPGDAPAGHLAPDGPLHLSSADLIWSEELELLKKTIAVLTRLLERWPTALPQAAQPVSVSSTPDPEAQLTALRLHPGQFSWGKLRGELIPTAGLGEGNPTAGDFDLHLWG
ncbi:hypothetical protein [Deinococcus radiophilus]|uniref:hypothetical protein n=1 Tax=Deinococcus radiophilus TaxID=32062 RepID=UPI00361CDBBD